MSLNMLLFNCFWIISFDDLDDDVEYDAFHDYL